MPENEHKMAVAPKPVLQQGAATGRRVALPVTNNKSDTDAREGDEASQNYSHCQRDYDKSVPEAIKANTLAFYV